MAKTKKRPPTKDEGPPDPRLLPTFERWLLGRPREWSVVVALRVALRVLPLIRTTLGQDEDETNLSTIALTVFRVAALSRFAAKYPNRNIGRATVGLGEAVNLAKHSLRFDAVDTADDLAEAADAADVGGAAFHTIQMLEFVASVIRETLGPNTAATVEAIYASVEHDVRRLTAGELEPNQLAASLLWPFPAPRQFSDAWEALSLRLIDLSNHWRVWTAWYEGAVLHEPHQGRRESEDAAFTDLPGSLPWDEGARAVNTEIARRLEEIQEGMSDIPDQSAAPVRVEERNGKVSKATDRDSALNATEHDFNAWRDPVVDHIGELSDGDFRAGTNHSRVRDRLTALGKLLPGEIAEVKERQFRIGYEIERFEGLLVAYKTGGDDMPQLNAAQLADLEHLRVALQMGINKLERWAEFRRQASESPAREGDADREVVAEALGEMAAAMEQRPEYFHPELPESFRALAEAARDPKGATKTVVFGAVRSAENLLSFLGRRTLDIGKKGVDALEGHISKSVAAILVAGLGGAALKLSGALPQGWAWLKPLLDAASKAIGAP